MPVGACTPDFPVRCACSDISGGILCFPAGTKCADVGCKDATAGSGGGTGGGKKPCGPAGFQWCVYSLGGAGAPPFLWPDGGNCPLGSDAWTGGCDEFGNPGPARPLAPVTAGPLKLPDFSAIVGALSNGETWKGVGLAAGALILALIGLVLFTGHGKQTVQVVQRSAQT